MGCERMKGKRKALQYELIKETIMNMRARKYQDFFMYLYASGARVNEALDAKKEDMKYDSEWFTITLRTEKHRRQYDREFPISVIMEKWLVDLLLDFRERTINRDSGKRLFNFSDRTALRYCRKYFSCDNHTFRHSRATHYAIKYDLNEQELMRLFGWSSTKPAIIYVHRNLSDIKEKMAKQSIVVDSVKKEKEGTK